MGGLLNGKPFAESSDSLPLIDPDSDSEIGRLYETSIAQTAEAVEAATRAFADRRWADMPLARRAEILRRTAGLIRENSQMLAAFDSLTTGLLWHRSTLRQTEAAAAWFEYFADLSENVNAESFATAPDLQCIVNREPVGVVALFTPWNIPLMAAALKLAAALAMGNSVVIKPSEISPIGTYKLVELLHEAGVPPGVVQLVNGRGEITGAVLAQHPAIGGISFTGGHIAGAKIATAAAARFAKITMELGGKSANIILADAPYEAALEGAVAAAFSNNGQACLAGSRIIVEKTIAKQFIGDLIDRTKALRIGHSFDENAQIGSQSSFGQMDRVLSCVAIGTSEGGQVLCGGRRANGFDGYQIEPTLMMVPSNELHVCQEEVFGPFATVHIVGDADEAVQVANDTRYGLAGYVWSQDEVRAQDVASRLRTGTVMVNTTMVRERNAPFGGYGASGVDREGGRWSLDFYSEAKAVMTRSITSTSANGIHESR